MTEKRLEKGTEIPFGKNIRSSLSGVKLVISKKGLKKGPKKGLKWGPEKGPKSGPKMGPKKNNSIESGPGYSYAFLTFLYSFSLGEFHDAYHNSLSEGAAKCGLHVWIHVGDVGPRELPVLVNNTCNFRLGG